MRHNFQSFDFPQQRVSNAEKNKPEWYAACCDWIIAQGQGIRDTKELEDKYDILNGKIGNEYYKKILNPYNATQEKYTRFPATMRNYDIIKGVVRRYVSEYVKNPHDFIVGANNPEVILAKNRKLQQELMGIVQTQIAARIQQSYQEFLGQGGDPKQFNPEEQINIEQFVKEFNENYIDDISAQGQQILNVIKDITEDTLFYARAYFDFVTFGECYTYADVVGTKLIKRNIIPLDAFPIPTDSMFVEDDDMFACRRRMTYQQIIDEFDEYLSEKDREFLDKFYGNQGTVATELLYSTYNSYFPEVCEKFSKQDRESFNNNPNVRRESNSGLYDVWHVVWRGEARRALVTFVNQAGLMDTRVEEDGYKLNPEAGDVSIEYIYEPQVYECTRIGGRYDAIYPYKARAIAYNRKGKLPYNGVAEVLPGFGKFSIVEILTPYQVFYNIVSYHREMILAKNKLSILMIAKSLLGTTKEEAEDTIYRMLADGVLYVDDTNDAGMLRAQQVRMLNASMGEYITQLTNLLQSIEQSAKDKVDMTPQRYGDIANSAGKAVTEEGIIRGSMGSVIIEYVMDCVRERDYARDMDYSKLAWIDGLDTAYRDQSNDLRYISLDVDKHIYADYLIKAKNSVKEKEKLDQLKQFAFNASQNGDFQMAVAAITGDNLADIKKLIAKFQEMKEQHEMEVKQMDQQITQMQQEAELMKIQAKGEEDRKTLELKGYIDQQIELIRADANMISYNAEVAESVKQAGLERLEDARNDVEREKIQLERERLAADNANKEADRRVKQQDIAAKLQIAKTNKNKHDSKSKK